MHSFWNQKAVIWNREHCGISGDFWLKSPQWGSSKSNCHPLRASLQHCSITEPLGGSQRAFTYNLLPILFWFDHSCASQRLWICNFSISAEWCTSHWLWVHLSFILTESRLWTSDKTTRQNPPQELLCTVTKHCLICGETAGALDGGVYKRN